MFVILSKSFTIPSKSFWSILGPGDNLTKLFFPVILNSFSPIFVQLYTIFIFLYTATTCNHSNSANKLPSLSS